MGIATGKVVAGKVQVEGISLAEGSVVTVLTPEPTGEIHLDAADEAALLEALDEARRGETLSPEELFARLAQRPRR